MSSPVALAYRIVEQEQQLKRIVRSLPLIYRAMGESNAVRVRRPLMRTATARRAAEIYAEKFGTEDGGLPATYQASPCQLTSMRTWRNCERAAVEAAAACALATSDGASLYSAFDMPVSSSSARLFVTRAI